MNQEKSSVLCIVCVKLDVKIIIIKADGSGIVFLFLFKCKNMNILNLKTNFTVMFFAFLAFLIYYLVEDIKKSPYGPLSDNKVYCIVLYSG